MPLLKQGVVEPVKGIDFSQPATFIDPQAGFPTNIRYFKGELRKRPGKTVLNEIVADSTQIMGLGKLELPSSKRLVRASKAKLEVLNTSADTWDSIANTAFSGGDDDFFDFTDATESGLLIITNGVDKIRKWTGSGNAALLGGTPPFAKYCTYLSPYVLIGYTNDGSSIRPWQIRWSDTDAPETWSGGNSGSDIVGDEPSPIQRILKLNEFVGVYKKEALYLGRKVDTADVFLFDCIKTGIGLGSPRAVADADGQHYFMALNDFYRWNGIREESIGGPVRDDVFARINRQKINRCFAVHVQELTEIWFFVVISGFSWPTEIWKYNYRTGFWYMDTCDLFTCGIKWERTNTLTWDDAVGTWDEQQTVWDSGTTVASWEDIVFGLSTGYCHSLDYTTTDDNGTAVSAYFITKDFIGKGIEFNNRWLQIDVWAKGPGKLYVDYSVDEGSNWVNIPLSSSTAYLDLDGTYRKYKLDVDVWSPQIRFRFRNAVSGEVFFIRNFMPYYLSREEVRA